MPRAHERGSKNRCLPDRASHGMTGPVRSFPSLLVFAALATAAFAQEQERTLVERIMKRDENLTFDIRQGSTSSKSYSPGQARVKEFGFSQGFRTKDFNAKQFRSKEYASKSAWMGDMRFQAQGANTSGKYQIPNLEKQAGNKTAAVKDSSDAEKAANVRAYAKGDRPYLGREADKMKQSLDKNNPPVGWQGTALKPLSIDDIREMLNKNK